MVDKNSLKKLFFLLNITVKKERLCYNDNGDNMKHSRKILFFVITTLILGTLVYLIIAKRDAKDNEVIEEPVVVEATIEEINYAKYLELRSEAHETETYAILIYNSEDEISQEFLEEVKVAFAERKAVVYILDNKDLKEEEYSGVIDDITKVMKYKNPQIIVPTILVMSKGDIVYKHAGLMYKEELMENLNAKSIE